MRSSFSFSYCWENKRPAGSSTSSTASKTTVFLLVFPKLVSESAFRGTKTFAKGFLVTLLGAIVDEDDGRGLRMDVKLGFVLDFGTGGLSWCCCSLDLGVNTVFFKTILFWLELKPDLDFWAEISDFLLEMSPKARRLLPLVPPGVEKLEEEGGLLVDALEMTFSLDTSDRTLADEDDGSTVDRCANMIFFNLCRSLVAAATMRLLFLSEETRII